jgi:hypothetical protein
MKTSLISSSLQSVFLLLILPAILSAEGAVIFQIEQDDPEGHWSLPFSAIYNDGQRLQNLDYDRDGVADFLLEEASENFWEGSWSFISGKDQSVLFKEDFTAINMPVPEPDIFIDDIDDDGVPDRVKLVTGEEQWHPHRIEVYSGTSKEQLFSIDPGHFMGEPIFLGDINGDGIKDFLVPALVDRDFRAHAAKYIVYSGSSGDVLFEITPPGENDTFHQAAVAIPDLNGDGIKEFWSGIADSTKTGNKAPWHTEEIFNGRDGSPLSKLDLRTSGNVRDYIHDSQVVPDVDGDGIYDLALIILVQKWDANDEFFREINEVEKYFSLRTGEYLGNVKVPKFLKNKRWNKKTYFPKRISDLNGDGIEDYYLRTVENDEDIDWTDLNRVDFMSGADSSHLFTAFLPDFRFGESRVVGDFNDDSIDDFVVFFDRGWLREEGEKNGYAAISTDLCPEDNNKLSPGLCGCGQSDEKLETEAFLACASDSLPFVFPGAPAPYVKTSSKYKRSKNKGSVTLQLQEYTDVRLPAIFPTPFEGSKFGAFRDIEEYYYRYVIRVKVRRNGNLVRKFEKLTRRSKFKIRNLERGDKVFVTYSVAVFSKTDYVRKPFPLGETLLSKRLRFSVGKKQR